MQRTDEHDRDPTSKLGSSRDADTGDGSGSPRTAPKTGLRDRFGPSLPRVFTPRGFLVALGLVTVGWLVASFVLPLGALGGLLGVAMAGFTLGLSGPRYYLEVALAGSIIAGLSAIMDHLVLSVFVGMAAPIGILGASSGALAAVVGNYFGRDLRDGLTREL